MDSLEVVSQGNPVADTSDELNLQLTKAAAKKGLSLLSKSAMPEGALRVAVRNGGCSGMRYELLFDADPKEDDHQLEFHGLRVWVDAESANFLDGITIDFSDTLNDAGFKIQNPKAAETCGCGESFAL
jgi:iron-sulfur cluster assembly protein